jgi:pyruvate dehydrogenase E1 component
VIKAQKELEENYDIAANVWSVTSYKELYNDANETDRQNMLKPSGKKKRSYIEKCMQDEKGVFVAATDYLKSLPLVISKWLPGPLRSLGTDGFGRSDDRQTLRDFFEVDYRYITLAVLYELYDQGQIKKSVVDDAIKNYEIDKDKVNPLYS